MICKFGFCVSFFCVYLPVMITSCQEGGFYLKGTKCLECPLNCTSCVSDSNCTKCVDGFFGGLCQTTCLENCPVDGCHLHYGYCTYGCPGGQYGTAIDTVCFSCPENCDLCTSMAICSACLNNSHGPNCSEICSSDCQGETCNQSTGYCFQCKDGYYRRGSSCLQCPRECLSCVNASYCSKCLNTHLGPFQGKCFRKCAANMTKFELDIHQRCTISLDKVKLVQSSCFKVRGEQSYNCTKLRYCIDCGYHGDECPSKTTEGKMCVEYERCTTECKPLIQDHVAQAERTAANYTLCQQTCSLYRERENKTDETCSLTTDDNRTRSDDEFISIDCMQELSDGDRFPIQDRAQEHSTIITVAVVTGCLIVILLTGIVVYHRKKRLDLRKERSLYPEIALGVQHLQHRCDLTSQLHFNNYLRQSPPVEHVYDRANCIPFVTDNYMCNQAATPPHRRDVQGDMYSKTRCQDVSTDCHPYNINCRPLQSRVVSQHIYETINDLTEKQLQNTPWNG